MKKFLSLILALLCVLSVGCAAADEADFRPVAMGQNTITIPANGAVKVCFTAPETTEYVITTISELVTKAAVGFSPTSTYLNAGGRSGDFSTTNAIRQDETIYLTIESTDITADTQVTLLVIKEADYDYTKYMPESLKAREEAKMVETGSYRITLVPGQKTYVRFLADTTDTFVFTTLGDVDTKAGLYQNGVKKPFKENDDQQDNKNFCIEQSLRSGYYFDLGIEGKNITKPTEVTLYIRSQKEAFAPWPVGETAKVYRNGNVRKDAGTEYKAVAYVSKGEKVEILDFKVGSTGKDWYKIKVNGKEGWISSTLVKLNGNEKGTINGQPIK